MEIEDEIYPRVVVWAQEKKDGSLSDLMCAFMIGYNRASWLVEKMVQNKAVERYDNGMSVRFRLPVLDKGTLGGQCNRTACKGRPATWWSSVERAHYCEPCAIDINVWCPPGVPRLVRVTDPTSEEPH